MAAHPHYRHEHSIGEMNSLIERIRTAIPINQKFKAVMVIRVRIDGIDTDLRFKLRSPHITRMSCQNIYYENDEACIWLVMGRTHGDHKAIKGSVYWFSKQKLLTKAQVC